MSQSAQTPEHQVIRRDPLLADLVRIHFKSVADALRNRGVLTDVQHREITHQHATMGGGEEKLIDAILIDIKTSSNPCESFVRFTDILERCGNLAMQRHINNTMKPTRKNLYRDLLKPSAGAAVVSEYDVFVSYGRQDNTNDFVDALAHKLEESQFNVFVDRSDIHPGDRWPDEISGALRSCKAFIAVLTKKYVRSHFCNGELFEAEALQKHLFPIVYEDGWDEGPAGAPVKEVVGKYQYVFCQPSNATLDEQYPALEKNLKKKMGEP